MCACSYTEEEVILKKSENEREIISVHQLHVRYKNEVN